jgi:hypothetical protein
MKEKYTSDMSEFSTPVESSTAGPLPRENLTNAQRRILDQILVHTYEIAAREAAEERQSSLPGSYIRNQFQRRPRHVFHIDGSRGAGKTTLLLTVREHLGYLGRGDDVGDHSVPREALETFDKIRDENDLSSDEDTLPEDLKKHRFFRAPHKTAHGTRRTALIFPVLFPSDLDDAQPTMEGLFAFMDQQLTEEIAQTGTRDRSELQAQREERAARARKLQADLYAKVAKSWFLSREEGIEAILRDSHNYDKFFEKRGRASGQSYRRVGDWRNYVNEYLDFFDSELLAIFIDDTDVIPDVSIDILHTLRVFLDHPRIVTIVAGNLRTLRQSMVWRTMSQVQSSMQALSSSDSPTAREWRGFMRRQIEEYLDKVIPRQQRHFLLLQMRPRGGAGKSDFSRFAHAASFDEYCKKRAMVWLQRFFQTTLKAHRRWITNRREVKTLNDRVTLEHLLSWWLLRHYYRDTLGPKTPRELKTLIGYTAHEENNPNSLFKRHKAWHEKRLAVILFENAENFELIHRFEDSDHSLMDWLLRQDLSSEWVGKRSFMINQRKIPENTYSYNYICYRLDLGLSIPLRENVESDVPRNLLPEPSGRNLGDRRPFFPIDWQPKTTSLLEAFNHSLIPANCLTMYDLQCLPDIAWQKKDTDNPWRPSLIYRWPKAFDLLAPRLAIRAASGLGMIDARAAEQQRRIEHYFFDVVIPMATLDIGRFVPEPDRPFTPQTFKQEHTLLWHETDSSSGFFSHDRAWFDNLRRRLDYISTTQASARAIETRKIYKDAVPEFQTDIGKPIQAIHHLVEYQWLLNDVRRAWHAARIFINQIGEFVEHEAASRNVLPDDPIKRNFFSRADRYRVTSLVSLIDEIKRLRPFNLFWERATHDAGDFVAAVKDPESHFVEWDKLTARQFLQMLVISDSSRFPPAELENLPLQSVEAGLLDIKSFPKTVPFLFSGHEDHYDYARLSRFLFFLIVGLGACFPAMIHIDIAGTLYPRADEQRYDDVFERIEDWRTELNNLQIFCFRYRASLERFFLRLEYLEENKEKLFRDYVSGSAVPDWSFSSMGIEGREGLQRRWEKFEEEKNLEHMSDLKKLLLGEGNRVEPNTEPGSQSSLFRDAEGFLNNAQLYLTLVQQVVEGRRNGRPPAPMNAPTPDTPPTPVAVPKTAAQPSRETPSAPATEDRRPSELPAQSAKTKTGKRVK